jgi:hypothetical protein
MVVLVDSDALFRNLELPLEWMLNRWNITQETSMALSLDVGPYKDAEGNQQYYTSTYNKYGDLNANTGFVISQNLPRTFDILQAWLSCPDNADDFPDCDKYRHGWPAEQGAFGENIPYVFNRTKDFVFIPCDDSMGFPGQGLGCDGKFVSHFTTGKHLVRDNMVDFLLQGLLSKAHDDFLDATGETKMDLNLLVSVEKEFMVR